MFQIGTPWKGGSEARTLAAIPETGPEPDQAAAAAAERVRLVGFCMTFLLGVSAPFSRMTWALPAGAASPITQPYYRPWMSTIPHLSCWLLACRANLGHRNMPALRSWGCHARHRRAYIAMGASL